MSWEVSSTSILGAPGLPLLETWDTVTIQGGNPVVRTAVWPKVVQIRRAAGTDTCPDGSAYFTDYVIQMNSQGAPDSSNPAAPPEPDPPAMPCGDSGVCVSVFPLGSFAGVQPAGGAPNNALNVAVKIASCTGTALKNNGVALVLDAAGFIPGESIAAAGAQTLVATASFMNSAYHKDAIGAGAAYVGSGVAPLGFIAKEAGFAWAKAIPFAGYIVNGVATAHDLWSTGSELYSCATKP